MASKSKASPLPLSDTLRDLALLRASDCDLSSVLSNTLASSSPNLQSKPLDPISDREHSIDDPVTRSYEFVRETRAVIRLLNRGEVERQGERLEGVRSRLEDVLQGLEGH
ncbi:hypothetical protein AcW1_003683 [Taiwanofungus camphoratus]|nr:hypothetical protein AcV5_003639 [Antrodia cinnamomea]KAI0940507.1 hypothetical protein AcW1_003683 [Antrodia cinnamomea]KAI0958322.1 hypothetical protein AcV7_004173 [Antrodia cinnamomea]